MATLAEAWEKRPWGERPTVSIDFLVEGEKCQECHVQTDTYISDWCLAGSVNHEDGHLTCEGCIRRDADDKLARKITTNDVMEAIESAVFASDGTDQPNFIMTESDASDHQPRLNASVLSDGTFDVWLGKPPGDAYHEPLNYVSIDCGYVTPDSFEEDESQPLYEENPSWSTGDEISSQYASENLEKWANKLHELIVRTVREGLHR